jgi:hypothetical protein
MSKTEDAGDTRQSRGILRRLFLGLSYFLIVGLAIVGVIAIVVELYGWHLGVRWRPEDLNGIFAYDSSTMRTARVIWEEIKYLIQYGAYLIAAAALFIAVTHIKTVAKLMSDFLDARGAIYQLAATMTSAEETARKLAEQAGQLSALEPTIKGMAEKIEEAMLKIGDLQRQSVSERSDASALAGTSGATLNGAATNGDATEDERNWEKLREFWNANGVRLDEAIERVPDKRRRTRYSRMDRRNYPAIINGLADDKIISETARKGSLDLHTTFMSYKPRNRKIPSQVIGDLMVKDRMLDEEFAKQMTHDDRKDGVVTVDGGVGATV